MSLRTLVAALLLAALLPLGACASQDAGSHDEPNWEIVDGTASYPLTTCPVSGKQLDATRVAINYEGEEVQLHCESDLDVFLADPEPALAKVRAARAR